MPNELEERNVVEQHEHQGVIVSSHIEEREMYIGSRRSCAWREVMEDIYRGPVQDIKDGCMIAFLATKDPCGYPLCAKVMKVNKENEEVTSVEAHWYAIDTHPFDGLYKPYMVV